ncbi:hypothetical protein Ciccas_009970 [Cichlidogyrus casuarinus]|uniref:Peptidase S9 prolyl oligopeptidase catalytic domain-containing protein n=1 Tax=Cichlidogyrus casuarinus TaxID=1844966 RepID=A0ABD2Q013_9PLAT
MWVDETTRRVLFEANTPHPLCSTLLSVSFAADSYGQTKSLLAPSDPAGNVDLNNHSSLIWNSCVACDPELRVLIRMTSDPATFPGLQMCQIDASNELKIIGNLRKSMHFKEHQPYTLDPLDAPLFLEMDMPDWAPELIKEEKLYGQLFIPSKNHQFRNESGAFPTIHFVYGGPGVRLIKSVFNTSLFMKMQILCHFGFAVFLCDCPGSDGRGLAWASAIKHKMGQIEAPYHAHLLKQAAAKTQLIDTNRVGIYGHSYGGYLTLLAACQVSNTQEGKVCQRTSPSILVEREWRGETEGFSSPPTETRILGLVRHDCFSCHR